MSLTTVKHLSIAYTFSYRDHNWFWVPVIGPHIGAIIGGWIYLIFVGIHAEAAAAEDEGGSQYDLEMMPAAELEKSNGSIGKISTLQVCLV